MHTLTPKNQLADIVTKGNFARDGWTHLLCLLKSLRHFNSMNSLEAVSRRTQEEAGGKIKADDEFGITIPCEGSERAGLNCIGKPGENPDLKVRTYL